jgi:hypothetical protein
MLETLVNAGSALHMIFHFKINQSVEDLSELLNQSILCTFVIPKLLTTTTSFAQVQCGDESAQSLYFVKKTCPEAKTPLAEQLKWNICKVPLLS